MHIWFISIYYREYYVKAGIPELPTVRGERATALASALLSACIFVLFAFLYTRGAIGKVATAFAALMTALLLVRIVRFYRAPFDKARAKSVYKFLNVYLGAQLVAAFVEKLLLS